MNTRNAFFLSFLLATLQATQVLAAFTVTEHSMDVKVVVDDTDNSDTITDTNDYVVSNDSPGTSKSVTLGANSNGTVISWTISGDAADLKVSFTHVLGSAEELSAALSNFTVLFQISTPSILTASGSFSAPSTLPNNISTTLEASFNDGSGQPPDIFNTTQVSNGESASFLLGDYYIDPLEMDHSYAWTGTILSLLPDPNSPASISGEFLLSIRAVPEAASFIIWSITLAMIGATTGRHRSKPRPFA